MTPNDLFEKLYNKVESLDDKLSNIDKTLVKQETNLELHMKRSDHLEHLVQLQGKRIEPIESHVNGVNYFMRITIGIIGLVSVVVGIFTSLK
jgi:hypothetical protein